MDANQKATTTPLPRSSNVDVPFSGLVEKSCTQAKEVYEKASSGTIEAAEILKNGCATAVKGVQEYNNKFMEFAHANSNSAFDFIQKLYAVKSPSAFIELSTEHSRKQFETLSEQSRQLTALVQKAARAAAEPVKAAVTKAFNHSA